MKIKLFLSAAICLSLSNTTLANNVDLCVTKIKAELYTEAVPYCEKACNLNDGVGCNNLGELYDKGHGVKQDHQRAKNYYEKSCNLNDDGQGCAKLGELYESKQDYQQAKIYYEKSCHTDDELEYGYDPNLTSGCNNLGSLYKNGKGVISVKEFKRILNTLGDKICEEEVDEIIQKVDPKNKGYIDYKELTKIIVDQ